MLVTIALWIQPRILNHYSLGSWIIFSQFLISKASTPNSQDDKSLLPCRYFSTAAFASGIFIAWGIGMNLCTKIVMAQWIFSFCSDVIFVIPVCYTVQSYSDRFVGIDNTSVFGLVFPNTSAAFSAAVYWGFKRHCCWHPYFQLSTSVFHGVFEFFIFWFNEEDTTHLSGIIELWFLDSPFFLCFAFRCIRHMLPHVWPYIVGSWGCFFSRLCPPGPCVSVMWPFDQKDESCEACPSSICLSNNTSSEACAVLVTSMYFNGIGNDSSFGMYSLTLDSTWWRYMKSPVISQKSFLASASSRVESSWRGVGEESSSDSPRKTSWSSPRQDDPWLKWMVSDVDLLQRVPFIGGNTSFALSLLASISDASIWSTSSMSAIRMSPFQISPAFNASKEYTWQDCWTKLM